jgi:hypothetical protein
LPFFLRPASVVVPLHTSTRILKHLTHLIPSHRRPGLFDPRFSAFISGKVLSCAFPITKLPIYQIQKGGAPTPGFTQFHPRSPNVTQDPGILGPANCQLPFAKLSKTLRTWARLLDSTLFFPFQVILSLRLGSLKNCCRLFRYSERQRRDQKLAHCEASAREAVAVGKHSKSRDERRRCGIF